MTGSLTHPRIEEIRLKNFRAFDNCRLRLDDLTILVGRNGSGKTSLLEAVDFVRDCLTDSLLNAIERRGGLQSVRRRTGNKGPDLSIAVVLSFGRSRVLYGFRLGHKKVNGGYVVTVKEEVLTGTKQVPYFRRQGTSIEAYSSLKIDPDVDQQSLLFPIIARREKNWLPIIRALRGMRVYSLSPFMIREEPPIGDSRFLKRDGSNLGDILKSLEGEDDVEDWIVEHLNRITHGIKGVRCEASSTGRRIIIFEQSGGGELVNDFTSGQMSDGTVRALAILVALRQLSPTSVVCIDEVEDSVHPAAMGVLIDAITSVSDDLRVVFTSHSPDALSHPAIRGENVRVVDWSEGCSRVFELSQEVRELLKPPHTVGKLLRSNALWTGDNPSKVAANEFFSV